MAEAQAPLVWRPLPAVLPQTRAVRLRVRVLVLVLVRLARQPPGWHLARAGGVEPLLA